MATVLWITVLGAGILFGAILALAAMMYLLTRLTAPRPERRPPAEAVARPAMLDDEDDEHERRRRVAVMAAAMARAGQEGLPPIPPAQTGDAPGEWQRLHRARRLTQPRRRT